MHSPLLSSQQYEEYLIGNIMGKLPITVKGAKGFSRGGKSPRISLFQRRIGPEQG